MVAEGYCALLFSLSSLLFGFQGRVAEGIKG